MARHGFWRASPKPRKSARARAPPGRPAGLAAPGARCRRATRGRLRAGRHALRPRRAGGAMCTTRCGLWPSWLPRGPRGPACATRRGRRRPSGGRRSRTRLRSAGRTSSPPSHRSQMWGPGSRTYCRAKVLGGFAILRMCGHAILRRTRSARPGSPGLCRKRACANAAGAGRAWRPQEGLPRGRGSHRRGTAESLLTLLFR